MLSDALNGMGEPWFIVVALVLTTFLLEDVAIAAGVALASNGNLSWTLAFTAVAAGIALGDVLLYWLGAGARRIKWLENRYITAETHKITAGLHNHLISATLLARVIPGLRLFTYTACGFTKVSLARFTVWVVIAVLMWTASLFWLSATTGHVLALILGVPESVAVTLPIIAIALAFPAYKYFKQHKKSSNPLTKNE
jgi:membrane protein DedA with SNARE-associated domain